jgi:hypothetical protein
MDILHITARVVAFLAGVYLTGFTLMSAVRTFVLPRSDRVFLTRVVFGNIRRLFSLRLKKVSSYAERDRIMAFYAPFALLTLPFVWLILIICAYTAIFWASSDSLSLREAFILSGSSMLTLGFAFVDELPLIVLALSEAMIGLVMVALLIAYLPTMYAAFSRREAAVTLMEVRAGSPPSALEMVLRLHRIQMLYNPDELKAMWRDWEIWFAEVDESHTSLAALVFFRSPKPDLSWVTAGGALLDATALIRSTVDITQIAQADLCLRAGYIALRNIADFFDIPHNPHPGPDDPISIEREEFDAVYDALLAGGIPVKADRDQCWRDFAGWRVNYDKVLLRIASLTMAPYAPWVSDRSIN